MKKAASIILILLGLGLLSFAAYSSFERVDPRRISFDISSYQAGNNSNGGAYPVVLVINSVGIKLPVYSGNIKNGVWQATTKGISFLETSATPGNIGNSIFYGHDWPILLGSLTKVTPGEKIRVELSDGSWQEYTIKFTQVVSPADISVLDQTNDKRITIYTCTGFFDSKRFVAVAVQS